MPPVQASSGNNVCIIIIQVDDTFECDTTEFLGDEKRASEYLKSQPRKMLSVEPTVPNGETIKRLEDGRITTTQADKLRNFKPTPTDQEFSS